MSEIWPFLDQNHRLTRFEKCQFFLTFWTSSFYSLERRFVLEYLKSHFAGLYCLKKKAEKLAIFGPKACVNPFGKNVNFLTFWTLFFYSLERLFLVLEYRKRHFPGLYWLKKCAKMAIFGPKGWVNLFGKKVNFSTFWTFCFYSLERCFFVLEYRKRHFPGPYA